MATEEIKKSGTVEAGDMDTPNPDQAAEAAKQYAKAAAEYETAQRRSKTAGNARAIAQIAGFKDDLPDPEDAAWDEFASAGRFASDGRQWTKRGRNNFRAILGLRRMDASRQII